VYISPPICDSQSITQQQVFLLELVGNTSEMILTLKGFER